MPSNSKEYMRQYASKNRERLRKYRYDKASVIMPQMAKWRETNRERVMWYSAKQRAALKKLDFTITVEDIVIPKYCPYLGCEITPGLGTGRHLATSPSLDRIDSTKGYTKDNIRVISDLANRMKRDASLEQLVAFAKGVLALHG